MAAEQATKEQFTHEELEDIWFALHELDIDRIFGAAPYSLEAYKKLRDKVDTMVEMKS